MKKISALSAALWLCLCQFVFASPVLADTVEFDVPAGELRAALDTYAKQAGIQILYRLDDVENLHTAGVHGRVDAEAALGVLLKGTALRMHRDASGAFAISRVDKASGNLPAPSGQTVPGRTPGSSPNIVAQAGAIPSPGPASSAGDRDTHGGRLDEVVVTGTHIRGAGTPAATVYVYTRDDIDQSGAATVQSFIQKLPQNFNGGASDSTISSVAGGSANAVGGTGVNLRGLGNDSTLVLIDGRRVAPGNTSGDFVDISLIPLSAVERIEIVTDGASAIYGSDAVGGVVNFIMRRDFDGAESRVRYGTDGRGGTHETEVGQTLGHNWNGGSALLSYEYSDRTALTATDRSITQSLIEPFTLLPVQVRHGVFGSAQQDLANGVQAFAEGTYSHRSTSSDVSSPFLSTNLPSTITTYSGTLGMRIDLPRSAQAEVSASYSASDTRALTFDDGALSDDQKVRSSIMSLDGKVDGSLGTINSRPVRYAVGGQYRKETFDDNDLVGMTDFNPSRSIAAGFVELRIPILGPVSPGASGSDRLELILADRGEHYSDFGSTNNPQIGLVWAPLSSLSVHGQFGTSFHAPLLNDLNPVPSQVLPYPETDPRTGGTTNTLIEFGGNPDLRPERAHTWSVGLDIHPTDVPGLRANLGYFNIRFTDRITNAQAQGIDLSNALNLENILGPQIIRRNPTQALVQALAATPGYADLFGTGINLATIAAIVDGRQLNLSTQSTDGADFGVSYGTETAIGRLETGITGTYLFSFDNRFTSDSPTVAALNTVYNPVDLKMRGHAALTRGPWSAAFFVNYVNSYKDNRADPSVPVASWTTVDVTLRYAPALTMGPFSNPTVALSVTNIANRDPPFVAPQFPGSYGGAAFDGANASLLGRFISLQASTRW